MALPRRTRRRRSQLRIGPLIEKRRAIATRDRTGALLQIATAAAANYRREKQERGLLDYDDLIDKTLEMLDRVSSGWVHYKLDRGVDHVLIDEAQDTSPRQWDIVAHIISEFTSGKGARDGVERTIFAVGDEKQSIFSFQGAAPHEFDARRRGLKSKFENAGLKFDPISFTYSFRSGPAILESVDFVFRDALIYRSIHAENAHPVHNALADAGLKLTSFNVDLAGGFASFQQQQQQQSSQQGASNGRNLLGGVDTPETDEATLTAAPNFGPPVLAGQNWSALNYLV